MADENNSATGLPPGEYLKRAMALAGLTATALAEELGVHPQTIYNVTTSKRPVSSALAVKLASRFVEPVEAWLSPLMDGPATTPRPTPFSERPRAWARLARPVSDPDYVENPDGILVDREIGKLLGGSHGVSISPFNPDQIQPASYDLTVGLVISKGFRSISVSDWRMLLRHEHEAEALRPHEREHVEQLKRSHTGVEYGQSFTLEPGKSIVVICREEVAFSTTYLAEVGSTSRNAINGLLVAHGFQIDPGYRGCITVTAMNISQESILLTAGNKILSLAIRKLPSPPDRAYRDDMARKVLRIAERVDRELKNIFDYTPLAGGQWKAAARTFDQTHIGATRDEVENKAVEEILEALTQRVSGVVDIRLTKAADEALESVLINQDDFSALVHRFDGVDADLVVQAQRHFRGRDDYQTLRDTLKRLDIDPASAVIGLAQDETLARHSD